MDNTAVSNFTLTYLCTLLLGFQWNTILKSRMADRNLLLLQILPNFCAKLMNQFMLPILMKDCFITSKFLIQILRNKNKSFQIIEMYILSKLNQMTSLFNFL